MNPTPRFYGLASFTSAARLGALLSVLLLASACSAQSAAPDTAAPDTAAPDTAAPDTAAPDTDAPGAAALDVGDAAPAFEATSDDGETWRSADHVGDGFLVVYFYPAAMTGGCTAQACTFRDNRSRLQSLGAQVVGVSGDRVDGLRAFKGSNRLNFPLLSDARGEVAEAFGVPVGEGGHITRTVDDREIELTRDVTTARWTFIIDPDGRIAYRDTQVDPAGDGAAVVAALERLVQER